ncbi:putative DNA modification/repair radical SAM protein [Natranaerovirga pectinivora]|uniref:Putative DNA modification/repair radical SAM protein n=1 Tax=Natranaerovirga pectinivora TaxID=682400 RepID=A0A4R3MIV5_9FIRM|nr:putative DNA modification/repair radical SAM protein [Natranaerovirga pectinivora]TCT11665.1 putative DNA modification/repair radical SAM protein [Natranaerovirga pectinivora]
MKESVLEKLSILADAAKYDVSCSTSGVNRSNNKVLGSATSAGICHTWSADGRCVSLLKILMTNYCVYDCEYCVNRISNDIKRASFSPEEVAELTIEFYRRNYIEGLFLSAGIEKNPNHTMERLVKVLLLLRNKYGFSGYIHLKAIPGADPILIKQAGILTDRMSVNIELPSENSLKVLAPQKQIDSLYLPMKQIREGIEESVFENQYFKSTPKFVPAGQSTQMIVGASPDTDLTIIKNTQNLYRGFNLKRVYFSAYVPVNQGSNLPSIQTTPPLVREHRLYQADWLLRFYKFDANELLNEGNPNFELDIDPKMMWALKNMNHFPMEINKVSYEELLRIPGIGVRSAQRIIRQRRIGLIQYDDLKKIGVVVKRAKYFITCNGKYEGLKEMNENGIREALVPINKYEQLTLF